MTIRQDLADNPQNGCLFPLYFKDNNLMEQRVQNKMGVKPVGRLLVSMSLPIMFSMLIQALYNIVDSMFVAQVSENALTAVSLAFPMQNLLIAVAVGTGVGINSLISRRLGERRYEEANIAASNGMTLSIISWAAFAIIGATLMGPFFRMFTDDATLVQMCVSYTRICLVFSFGVFVSITCERILQSTGDTIHPMIIQIIGCVVNIILDPIMIFGLLGFPAMGVTGAAIATVIGQIIAMGVAVFFVLRNRDVHVRLKEWKLEKQTVKDIYAVGLPAIIMQSIGTLMTVGINKILISFTTTATAVFGVYFKLQSFVFMPIFGLNSGMIPILGFNYGAKQPKRMTKTVKVGVFISLGIMATGTLLFQLFPSQLLSLFNPSPDMTRIGVVALRAISLCFISAGISISLGAVFQATGDGYLSMIISIARQLVFVLPVAWLMGKAIGLDGVWFAFPIAEVASLILTVIFYKWEYKKRIAPLYLPDSIPN